MFKAKLIENKNYYDLRTKQALLMLLPCFAIGLLVNFYQIPIWVTILMIGCYIVTMVLIVGNQKRMKTALGNKVIEIDIDEIRIKSKKGNEEETIDLNEVEKISLKDEYSIPQESIKELGQELTGKTKQNYVMLHKGDQKRKLDFEIDSYYMINQLNKIIATWKAKGYQIETIN